ncbi:hypothetical protein [Leifsonia sp. NPDC058248]|uniref:hypothetical protein n=1 Tax=Leifsonia sp. NPDC058248 TaxID=3346402 RepID=UPI0036D7EE54
MSNTTPEAPNAGSGDAAAQADSATGEVVAPATAPAETAAAAPAAAAPTSAKDAAAEPHDTDPGVVDPPSKPVSARGHVNHPEDGSPATPAAPKTRASAKSRTAAPTPVEPEPVVTTNDDVAAAVARTNTGDVEATPAAAAGSATIDTASPAESATPVIVAAEAATAATAAAAVTPSAATTATAAAATTAPAASAPEAAWAAGSAAAPTAAYAQQVTPIYVQRPEPPKKKSNRGFGILYALVGTLAFAILWAAAVVIVGNIFTPGAELVDNLLLFVRSWQGWTPVVVFFVGMVVLIQILNRARWWAYILGGLVVAVLVYFSFVGAALMDNDITKLTPNEAGVLVSRLWVNPFAVLAGVIAREVTIWTGAWLAARGRKLKIRNAEAQADYDQRLADAQNQAVAAYATPAQNGY